MSHVIVVGGGWAGLSAALQLSDQGKQVTLLEASPQLGGRAREVSQQETRMDNGQHLLLGAYRSTLELLQRLGLKETELLHRQALCLPIICDNGKEIRLQTPTWLPAPLHLLWALLRLQGLDWRTRLAAIRFSLAIRLRQFRLKQDISVEALLQHHRQPLELVQYLWAPLCLAALNTPMEQASARLFLTVLRDAFSRRRQDSDLLIPKQSLSALLPTPAASAIVAAGGKIRFRQRVARLWTSAESVCGVITSTGETLQCDQVILATGPRDSARLLAPLAGMEDTVKALEALKSEAVTTVYLQYPPTLTLPEAMLGLGDMLGQWLFDLRINGHPGRMAVVISGNGEYLTQAKDAVGTRVREELAERFPHWPTATDTWVIREKQATLHADIHSHALRPQQQTPIKGLWLAGDYVASDYPSTLEAAVRSGVQCAAAIGASQQT